MVINRGTILTPFSATWHRGEGGFYLGELYGGGSLHDREPAHCLSVSEKGRDGGVCRLGVEGWVLGGHVKFRIHPRKLSKETENSFQLSSKPVGRDLRTVTEYKRQTLRYQPLSNSCNIQSRGITRGNPHTSKISEQREARSQRREPVAPEPVKQIILILIEGKSLRQRKKTGGEDFYFNPSAGAPDNPFPRRGYYFSNLFWTVPGTVDAGTSLKRRMD